MPKVTKIRSLHIFAIFPEKCLGKVDYFRAHKHKTFLQADGITFFCLQISIKDFFNLILLFWACVAGHSHITQNNKFAISLQCLKKEVSDEVDFFICR